MQVKRPILFAASFVLLLVGGICVFLVAADDSGNNNHSAEQNVFHASIAGAPEKPITKALASSGTELAPARSWEKSARAVYLDGRSNLETRFTSLMEMAKSGDRDALHLAFQIQRNCEMWAKLSPEKFLPELWKPEIGTTLAELNSRCAGLLQTPESQQLADSTKKLPNDAFDHDVREKIRQAFADGGADSSVFEALKAYRARPDPATGVLVVDTLNGLDVINLDPNLALAGLEASEPGYRRRIFSIALDMLACDYGENCGPNSTVVLSWCINAGVCKPGYSLDQIYENFVLSGDELQNVRKVLDYLRKLSATNP